MKFYFLLEGLFISNAFFFFFCQKIKEKMKTKRTYSSYSKNRNGRWFCVKICSSGRVESLWTRYCVKKLLLLFLSVCLNIFMGSTFFDSGKHREIIELSQGQVKDFLGHLQWSCGCIYHTFTFIHQLLV